MYHDPQNGHNQPPHPQYPSTYHQPNAHNQPWPQPAYPQTPGPQPFPSAPPLLPPKPEPNSQWAADQALSPLVPPGPPPWMYPATDQTQRTNSLPTSAMSAVPRLGDAIPPEHVRMLDAGKHQAEASMMPTSPQFHLQPGPPSRFTPSPAPHGHNLSPQVFPQMGAMSPQMNNLSPLSPGPPPTMSAGDAARVRSYSHSYFAAPPPPPPIMNRGHTPVPAPPSHAPPLPHMQSEPHFSATQQQHSTVQPRQLSLPVYPQAPGTPAPNMLPPAPPTPAPPTPAPPTHTPAFPMPFASAHVPVRQDANAWVGGIAPRPNTHYRPFQPMPSIPQASPMGQPPPPPRAPPPPPPPPALGIEMPVPMIGANGPPPLPPPPKHAVTSPTVLTHGPWSDGLHKSGTVTTNKLPLPPKERVPTNELPLPPKVPVASPSTLTGAPSTSTVGNSPTLIASPLVSEGSHNHEEELREALRLSLADSAGVRGTDEDEELRRALEASILEASFNDSGYVGHYDSPGGSSLNARSPVSRRTPPPEQDPVHALKPAPALPRQESAPSALERASGSTIPLATSLPRAASSSSPVVGSAPSQVPPVDAHEDDEPPPPTYEEVTSSASRSPAMTSEPARPVIPAEPSAHSSPGPLFGAASRAPLHRSEIYPRESRSPPPVAEPPVIEIIPPSHNNSLVRREPEQPAIQPVERPQNVAPPAEAPRAQSPPRRPEPVQRSATASPPAVPRPRAASHARPASEVLPHAEYGGTGLARQRVMSASHANAAPASRMTRASMFFTGKNTSNSVPPSESPHRTWAIDEEPSGSSGGLMLQPPEPASTLLHSRNASKTNLNEVQADAPLVDDLLQGVSYGFRDPDPPSPVPMPPAQPFPPSIMIGENSAFHIQGPNFRHLLRLLSHYGGTNIQATPAAIAASKSGEHAARVVLYFIKGNHDRDPWLCRLFLELHTPGANETVPVADTSELWKDSTIQALAGPRGKLYVVPGPLPVLPLSFQGLSTFLVARLESATRAPSDSSPRRLERILVECYGSVSGAAAAGEEIGGRQKGSGNISFGGLFSKVKDKFSSDKGGTTNIHTYDLISPFHVDEYR